MNTQTSPASNYVFGHSNIELQRLINQASYFGDLTEEVFRRAGLATGMRVLDVGCGSGDVSFLVASLVGPAGQVIGIDKSAEAVALAQARAKQAGLEQVRFETVDISQDFELTDPVDAIVGRFILMHLADSAAALNRLVKHLKPGGLIIFQEMDGLSGRCVPESALFNAGNGWMGETMRRAGFEVNAGTSLYSIFLRAGLPAPQMHLGAHVETGPDSPGYEIIARAVGGMLPLMERFGVTTAEEVQIETFAARLREEVVGMNGVMITPALIGAWTRKPN
jgi:SAM-dependent methyltransferase